MGLAKKFREKVPRRAILGAMMFLACMFSYVIRTNLSIIIVAMVENKGKGGGSGVYCAANSSIPGNSTTNTTKDLPDYGERFDWNQHVQAFILSGYFYGVLPASIPAGLLAEKFGGSRVVAFATLIPALLNLLMPWASSLPYAFAFVLRFSMGFFGSAVYPALHAMIARWVPPSEKGMFVWTMQGGPFGTVVTFALCGQIISSLGWKAAYYITSGLMLVFYVLWVYLVYDTPEDHPGITEEEKLYIKEQIGTSISKQKGDYGETKNPLPAGNPLPTSGRVLAFHIEEPWSYIQIWGQGLLHTGPIENKLPVIPVITSIPFLVLLWAHFANMWGIYFISTNGPKYTLGVLGFNMDSGGAITGLPYIARLGAGVLFAAAGDYARRKNYLTVLSLRKTFTIFSHLLPAICLIGMTYAGCDSTLAISMLILSLGFNGAACQTSLVNHQDLAPNYAGSLYGVMNTIGSFPGFIIPPIIGFLTNEKNGVEEWRVVFWISAGVFISATILFWLFGSVDIQPWNDLSHEKDIAAVATLADEEGRMINGSKAIQALSESEEEENARL